MYEVIFGAFGAKPLAQVAAAVLIGAVFGVLVLTWIPAEDKSPRGLIVAGCAGMGLFAGLGLVYADSRKRRAEAASAAGLPAKRPMNSVVLVVLMAFGALVLILLVSLVTVVYSHTH
ncbi:MAG: hypothetical protein ABIP55_03845 [Tepidisphaeraceae bacterium]